MNRKLLIQVTAPAVVIGFLLFGACLVSAWYINRLQSNLTDIRLENVTSLHAAQQLEIYVRQLRFHCYLYLIDPRPALLEDIRKDDEAFEHWLGEARKSANEPDEFTIVAKIKEGYDRYRRDFDRMRSAVTPDRPRRDFHALGDANPVVHVVEPCRALLALNQGIMDEVWQESDRVSRQIRSAMLFVGLGGPFSGLIMGYGMARGLSRSIYRLSVHVQDLTQQLEQEVGSVSVTAGGDIQKLDQQLQTVVQRVQDVAERLHRHQREMLRAQHLGAVGQLAASVAHEVRNPLTGMKLLVEAALRSRNRKPLSLEDLEVIHGEIAKLEQIVQGFLDFARLPTPKRRPCDLRDVVTQAVELIRPRARQQGVALDVQCPDRPVPGHADQGQLGNVLVNLCINALDAMPAGGRLGLELAAPADGEVRLAVADTGRGIPPEMNGRLFTPFASTKPGGTGLGLSISQRIVEEHGGRIRAANQPHGGARFVITLPAGAAEGLHADLVGH
jgi:signal transduction histidine kinase